MLILIRYYLVSIGLFFCCLDLMDFSFDCYPHTRANDLLPMYPLISLCQTFIRIQLSLLSIFK